MRAALFTFAVLTLVWSAIAPSDRTTWVLESFPGILGLIALAALWKKPTPLLFALICLHTMILFTGGKYSYAHAPFGEWCREWFGWTRNNYDKLGHFAQGAVPAILWREILIRHSIVNSARWRAVFVVSMCLAFSALYELFEWATALVLGQGADEFLGSQGDIWDTQSDMFMALLGAIVALALLSRWHNRQLSGPIA